MRTPPQNETEYWDRVIEFAAAANEITTAEDVRAIMGLRDEVMTLIDKEAYESFRKRQPNPNRPIEDMIDMIRMWETEIIAEKYREEGLKPDTDVTKPSILVPTDRSRALFEAELALVRATTRDQGGDLVAMERVYRLYRALYKAYIAARKEQNDVR
jgi:hypothetical protein